MKHYFFLVLNTNTYETYYDHGSFTGPEDIKTHLEPCEQLVRTWTVVNDEAV